MENHNEFNDEVLGKFVKMNAKTLQNEAFEDQLMSRVEEELAYKSEVSQQLKLSFRIFLFGLIAGIILIIAILFKQMMSSLQFEIMVIVILFAGGVLGTLNIGNYRRLIRKYAT